MATDLDKLKQHASALYDELHGTDQPEADRLLRKMIYQLEMMDDAVDVTPSTRDLANWLIRLCDVEHGVLIKHYPDSPNKADEQHIEGHVKIQQQQLQNAIVLYAEVERGIKHLAGMLGVTGIQEVDVSDRINWFGNALLEHLRADRDMGEKLHQLALATMQSLQSVQQMMGNLGEESPELLHVATMLERPIPADPVKARDYLKQVSHDLQHVQQQMVESGKAASLDINKRVQAFENVSTQLAAVKNEERSDALTGLPNRRALIDYLESQSRQGAATLGIVVVDQLQQIIVSTGQAGGNRCLCEMADLLVDQLRTVDMVFRMTNDKFILVFPDLDAKQAESSAISLHANIGQMQLSLSSHNFNIQTTFGLAERQNGEKAQRWIKRADAALYIAKGKGGNCVEIAP